ncbi:hypothetical protein [Rahnella aceris]|uniref:hypothetical protein n=1 Tax=Rahnella sp. (strain Y9602) TaxID=2703885 RepID=UPI0019061EBE|nr:hypothetical protein [Rahnella aceris]QQN33256.1 hypothetical protein JHW33_12285 [Rahnella aceris]
MADIDDIATRIAGIILSPDSVYGLINGALTVPVDFGYMVYGIFDTGSRYIHETMRIRMADAIRNDILNHHHISEAVKLVFTEFNKYVSETEQDKIYRGVVSSVLGRLGISMVITKISGAVLERVSFISASSSKPYIGAISTILMIGGMSERSIRTSESLQAEFPEIYKLLRPRDYDLLYFLFKPSVQPFVDAIHVRMTQGEPTFIKIMDSVEKKINAA